MSERQPEPRYLAVGQILRPHGVRGELRAEIYTDDPEHLSHISTVYLGRARQPYTLTRVRMHQDIMLLTFKECQDRNAAELLRGLLVEIAIKDAVPLESEEYYHFQLVGMQVETDEGETLGEIVEVFEAPGANDVLIVHGPRGEVLLPVIQDVILDLDFEAQQVLVHILPGLLAE